MHKNKYDHNILLNDIQKLDKIQHKHSLVAIQFPDTSAEKKYLVYYDERWDCKLFLNYKTVDRADEESVINKVTPVKVWRGEKGDNTHCTTKINIKEWETAKS